MNSNTEFAADPNVKRASAVLANLYLRNVANRIFSLIASEKVEEKGKKVFSLK